MLYDLVVLYYIKKVRGLSSVLICYMSYVVLCGSMLLYLSGYMVVIVVTSVRPILGLSGLTTLTRGGLFALSLCFYYILVFSLVS